MGLIFLRVIGFSLFFTMISYHNGRKPCLSRASEKSIAGFGVKEAIKMSSIPVPFGWQVLMIQKSNQFMLVYFTSFDCFLYIPGGGMWWWHKR